MTTMDCEERLAAVLLAADMRLSPEVAANRIVDPHYHKLRDHYFTLIDAVLGELRIIKNEVRLAPNSKEQ